ncbi:guanine-specific ribonuclease N1 and T1 [Actinomadura barringtoniae]|uniref:Guanine-specific ribonuclease N1 and T1 n=1 Tax=Actinomadura barringtoniae TaxID=1427535 RepID=A0A939TBH4_9ACTN|nr:ribonuclease domain-containing protein [Actinomadura barringtoniae]MBO2453562.1 guanine-specific ribonuclease N1 and T1 [Actinomadura barringtoniae]
MRLATYVLVPLIAVLSLGACTTADHPTRAASSTPRPTSSVAVATLPAEAQQTLKLIDQGGPFPYRKDGSVFSNRERRLPREPRGYYREYTVPTPGSRDRGARRIIAGKEGERYYTGDHYRTFQQVTAGR